MRKPKPATTAETSNHHFKLAGYGPRWFRALHTDEGDRWASALERGDASILRTAEPDLSNAPTRTARFIVQWLSMNRPRR